MALRFSRIVLLVAAVVLALVWSAGGDSPTPVSAQTPGGTNRPAVTSDPVDGYMILAPSVLRSGQTEPISISLFSGQQPARGTVTLALFDQNTLLAEAEGNIEGTGSIPLTVPRISQDFYYLSVRRPGLPRNHESVFVDSGDVLFVETDKPVYNPGQDMRIRVLLLDVELKPLSGDVTVEVQDAKDTRIFREHVRLDEFGMATLSMPISAEPNLGDWKITASYEDSEAQTEVQVERYVLPKYEIDVAFPHEWTPFGEPITGTVSARIQLRETGAWRVEDRRIEVRLWVGGVCRVHHGNRRHGFLRTARHRLHLRRSRPRRPWATSRSKSLSKRRRPVMSRRQPLPTWSRTPPSPLG